MKRAAVRVMLKHTKLSQPNHCTVSRPAHKHTGDHVNKCTEEATVFAFVQENTDPVDLGGRDDKHDNSNKNGEIAVGLQNAHL